MWLALLVCKSVNVVTYSQICVTTFGAFYTTFAE